MALYRVRDNGLRLADFNKKQRKVIDKVFATYNINCATKDIQAFKEVWIGNFEEDFLRSWFRDEKLTLKELVILWCEELEIKSE